MEDAKEQAADATKVAEVAEVADIADKQQQIVSELKELKEDLATMQNSMKEILELFQDGKSVLKFMAGAGKFARWAALTIASIAAIWASITHLDKTN